MTLNETNIEYGLKITPKNQISKIEVDEYLKFLKHQTDYIKYDDRGFNGVEWDIYEMKEYFLHKEKKDGNMNHMASILNSGEVIFGDVLIFFQTEKDFNKYYKFWGEYIKTLYK